MSIRVLVAEDEPILRRAVATLIERTESLELVGLAEDAGEAIEMAESTQPDVALVDVKMPEGGGPRATREIRTISPRTKILAYSGYDDRSTVLEMVRAGAHGYLVKGSPPADLVDAIVKVANGLGTISSEVIAGVFDELAVKLEHEAVESELQQRQSARISEVLDGDLLTLIYQPVMDLQARHILGFECLARFNTEPYRPPNVWFAEAAAVGMGVELEMRAIEIALSTRSLLPEGLLLNVNASPSTIVSTVFSRRMANEDLSSMVLEITEHAAIDNYDRLEKALEDFRAAGGRLAVDDAGAGFASLRHILRLAPEEIKLDISLTRGIHLDRRKKALGAALISFAHEIEAVIVAEGVEEQAELDALVNLGVKYGQGYFLARPGPLPPLGTYAYMTAAQVAERL